MQDVAVSEWKIWSKLWISEIFEKLSSQAETNMADFDKENQLGSEKERCHGEKNTDGQDTWALKLGHPQSIALSIKQMKQINQKSLRQIELLRGFV